MRLFSSLPGSTAGRRHPVYWSLWALLLSAAVTAVATVSATPIDCLSDLGDPTVPIRYAVLTTEEGSFSWSSYVAFTKPSGATIAASPSHAIHSDRGFSVFDFGAPGEAVKNAVIAISSPTPVVSWVRLLAADRGLVAEYLVPPSTFPGGHTFEVGAGFRGSPTSAVRHVVLVHDVANSIDVDVAINRPDGSSVLASASAHTLTGSSYTSASAAIDGNPSTTSPVGTSGILVVSLGSSEPVGTVTVTGSQTGDSLVLLDDYYRVVSRFLFRGIGTSETIDVTAAAAGCSSPLVRYLNLVPSLTGNEYRVGEITARNTVGGSVLSGVSPAIFVKPLNANQLSKYTDGVANNGKVHQHNMGHLMLFTLPTATQLASLELADANAELRLCRVDFVDATGRVRQTSFSSGSTGTSTTTVPVGYVGFLTPAPTPAPTPVPETPVPETPAPEPATPTPAETPTKTVAATPTATLRATPTPTAPATPTPIATTTSTLALIATLTRTVPVTRTPTATLPMTPTRTAPTTSTATPPGTNTPTVPATSTLEGTPTQTAPGTPSPTPMTCTAPVTSTPTPPASPTPTARPTSSPTAPATPTHTSGTTRTATLPATQTPTALATPTVTVLATRTPAVPPTPTPTPTLLATPTATVLRTPTGPKRPTRTSPVSRTLTMPVTPTRTLVAATSTQLSLPTPTAPVTPSRNSTPTTSATPTPAAPVTPTATIIPKTPAPETASSLDSSDAPHSASSSGSDPFVNASSSPSGSSSSSRPGPSSASTSSSSASSPPGASLPPGSTSSSGITPSGTSLGLVFRLPNASVTARIVAANVTDPATADVAAALPRDSVAVDVAALTQIGRSVRCVVNVTGPPTEAVAAACHADAFPRTARAIADAAGVDPSLVSLSVEVLSVAKLPLAEVVSCGAVCLSFVGIAGAAILFAVVSVLALMWRRVFSDSDAPASKHSVGSAPVKPRALGRMASPFSPDYVDEWDDGASPVSGSSKHVIAIAPLCAASIGDDDAFESTAFRSRSVWTPGHPVCFGSAAGVMGQFRFPQDSGRATTDEHGHEWGEQAPVDTPHVIESADVAFSDGELRAMMMELPRAPGRDLAAAAQHGRPLMDPAGPPQLTRAALEARSMLADSTEEASAASLGIPVPGIDFQAVTVRGSLSLSSVHSVP